MQNLDSRFYCKAEAEAAKDLPFIVMERKQRRTRKRSRSDTALNLSPETSCSRLWIRKTLPTSFVQPNPDNCIAPVPTSAPTIKGATYHSPHLQLATFLTSMKKFPYLASQGLCKVATYRDNTNAIVTYDQYNYFCTCPFEVIYQNANGLESSGPRSKFATEF